MAVRRPEAPVAKAAKVVAQMNDLTTVFPLAKSDKELAGYLTATSSGD